MKLQRYDVWAAYDGDYGVTFDYQEKGSGRWCESKHVAVLETSHAELLKALKNLYCLVQGECPSLLDEDSGGSAHLDIEISDAIAKAEGTKQ